MIKRIVRMTFLPEKTEDFLAIFKAAYPKISSFEGCHSLELLQDSTKKNVFVTLSLWQDEQALEQYRSSALFEQTWAKTKILFAEKPMAFSLYQVQ